MSAPVIAKIGPKDANEIPDPQEDPAGYLLAHKWRPLGEIKRSNCRWIDPTRPLKDSYERKKVGVRQLPNGTVEEVFQTHFTAAAFPVSRDEAVAIQMERDWRAQITP